MSQTRDFIMHYDGEQIDLVIQKVMSETYFNYLGEKTFRYPKGDERYSFLFPKAKRGDWFSVDTGGHDGGPGNMGIDAETGDIFVCLFDTVTAPFGSVASKWLWMGKMVSGYTIYLNGYQIASTSEDITDSDTIKSAFGKLEGKLSIHKQQIATLTTPGHIKSGGEIVLDTDGNVNVIENVFLKGSPTSETDFENLPDKGVVTIEYLKSRLHLSVTEYGIRRLIGSSSTEFERIKKQGLDVIYNPEYTVNIGVGTETLTNDFDNFTPWGKMILCNVDSNGEPVAYTGDPEFTIDGTNGPVMVEIPLFYQRYQYNPGNDGYEYWWISEEYVSGYYLNPRFINKQKLYVGAYLAGFNNNAGATKAFTLSDESIPDTSKNYVWDDSKKWDDKKKWFSNRSYLTSKSGEIPVTDKPRNTLIKSAKSYGESFSLIDIHTWNILEYLFWIEFAKFDSQSIMKGYTKTSNTGVIANGETDQVTYITGSYQSNIDGLHPMKYRGIENLYGMMNQLIDGVMVENNQPYINDTPDTFDITRNEDYEKSSLTLPGSPGYINQISSDSLNHLLPISATGNSTSGVADYYENDERPSEKCILIGGKYNDGDKAGISSVNTKMQTTQIDIPFTTRIIC